MSKRRELSTRRAGFEQRSAKHHNTVPAKSSAQARTLIPCFGCKGSPGLPQLGCHSLMMNHEPLLLCSPFRRHPLVSNPLSILVGKTAHRNTTIQHTPGYSSRQPLETGLQLSNNCLLCTRRQLPLELEKSSGKVLNPRGRARQEMLGLREVQKIQLLSIQDPILEFPD